MKFLLQCIVRDALTLRLRHEIENDFCNTFFGGKIYDCDLTHVRSQ